MNFTSKNDGKWFWFDGAESRNGGICIRVLSIDESRRIDRLTVKTKYKPVRGQMTKIDTTDEEMRDRLIWDYCIVAWRDINLDGKSLECTTDNKVQMMKNNMFAAFFLDKISELNEETSVNSEDLEKNSKTSSSGSAVPIAKTV